VGGPGAKTLLLAGAAIASLGADQLTKVAVARLRAAPIAHAATAGATFLALSVRQAMCLWCGSIGCLALMIVLGAPLSPWSAVGVGLAVGGATGNLVDRVARGGVVDFIALGRWTTFNLADAAMTTGLGLSIWGLS